MTAPDLAALSQLLGRRLTDSELVVAVAAYGQRQVQDQDFWVTQGLLKAKDLIEKAAHGG